MSVLEFQLSEDRESLDIICDEAGWLELQRVALLAFRSEDHQHMFDKSWGISEAVLTVSPGSTTSMSKVTFYPIGKTEGPRS